MKRLLAGMALGAALAVASTPALAQRTLEQVKQRGSLVCGSNTSLAGFGQPDDKGAWTGLDVDYCRAIAAAIFNDPTKVQFRPLSAKDRFTALQSGEIDALVRNTTWTMSRDTQLGLDFGAVNYFDGQGFMVRKGLNVASAKDLGGAAVCTQQGTTTEQNLTDYFRGNRIEYKAVVFATADETVKAYDAGRCDAFTTDVSGLYAEKMKLTNPDDHVVLPDVISKEPLGPAVRHGDNQWGDLIKWVHYAMVAAEELGVTKANVEEQMRSENPEVRRLLGVEGKFGEAIGLSNDWAVRIVRHVGNYGESFNRNVGPNSRLAIPRGLNDLWTKGGLQYAPPIR